MTKFHYGFFARWRDFFLHPSYLFEKVVFERLESSFMPLIPALGFVFAYFVFLFQLSRVYFLRFDLLNFIVFYVVVFFVLHGSFRLLKGEGCWSDTLVVWTHVFVYSVLTQLIMTVLVGLGYLGGKWLMVAFAVLSAILSIWAFVSAIIGYMVAHNIGVIRTILALFVSGIVIGLLFLVTQGVLFELLDIF